MAARVADWSESMDKELRATVTDGGLKLEGSNLQEGINFLEAQGFMPVALVSAKEEGIGVMVAVTTLCPVRTRKQLKAVAVILKHAWEQVEAQVTAMPEA